MSRPIADEEARRRIREDLDATLVVEAAAGTGKTTMLVARIVAVLEAGKAQLDRIVAVTFTEKAAGEMKLRLRAALEKERTAASASETERLRLDEALAQLEVAKIGTIHSLCADLLRERPVEAKVDPLFEVMPEDEAERLFDQAFDRWFQETLADPPEGVRRMLRRRPRGRDRIGPRDALRDAAYKLAGHRDFEARFRRDPFDRDPFIDRVVVQLAEIADFADKADRSDDWLAVNLKRVDRFIQELGRREKVRARDHDGLEAELGELAKTKEWKYVGGRGQNYGSGLKRADVREMRDAAKKDLDAFVQYAGADLAAVLQDELRPLFDRYAALKRKAGKLDFLDLLLGARDLVKQHADVRRELQERTSHLFVDEFQDTDPLQAEILLLLAASDANETDWTRSRPVPGKLFLVGDPKQSIYRFRRADVALYQEVKERLLGQGAALLHLVTSFRSAPSIQTMVNAAFAPVMMKSPGGSQAEYVALQPFRDDVEGQPSVIALPVPRPYSPWGKVTQYAVADSLPDAVGAFVSWLVDKSGFKVSERESGGLVPVEARHVCLLFKRFQNFGEDTTRAFVRALEARRVPHVLVGGRSFHEREEVQAVVNALSAIEWPDDELAVYATLRGPFFALSDDALLAYRAQEKNLSPLRRKIGPHLELIAHVTYALDVLRLLHLGRNRRPIADTVARLLEETRAHAGVAIWPTGEQSLANVLRVMDLARKFESSGATSFRAFVERLARDAAEGQAGEAPVVEEGTEGVRIMTVHRAKGLEFPVVILADPLTPTLQGNPPQPSRFVDPAKGIWAEAIAGLMPAELVEHRREVLERDAEESHRLAYVAATRARDLLVIPAVGDASPKDEDVKGWLDVLYPGLYPEPEDRRAAGEAPGCPPFGDDSVLERPSKVERGSWSSVMPGLHVPRAGEHRVVWWDPGVLELDKQPQGGLRQDRILQADKEQNLHLESQAAHAAWKAKRVEVKAKGERPTTTVRTATELAKAEQLSEAFTAELLGVAAAVTLETTAAPREKRPRQKRFGILVHAVLAEIEYEQGAEHVQAVALAQGRLAAATTEEVEASVTAVIAALEHPVMLAARAAMKAGSCRREVPVVLPLANGEVMDGTIDLCFREGQGKSARWTVVDFKTDAELGEERRVAYARQVALYCDAVTRATGDPAVGVLLSV